MPYDPDMVPYVNPNGMVRSYTSDPGAGPRFIVGMQTSANQGHLGFGMTPKEIERKKRLQLAQQYGLDVPGVEAFDQQTIARLGMQAREQRREEASQTDYRRSMMERQAAEEGQRRLEHQQKMDALQTKKEQRRQWLMGQKDTAGNPIYTPLDVDTMADDEGLFNQVATSQRKQSESAAAQAIDRERKNRDFLNLKDQYPPELHQWLSENIQAGADLNMLKDAADRRAKDIHEQRKAAEELAKDQAKAAEQAQKDQATAAEKAKREAADADHRKYQHNRDAREDRSRYLQDRMKRAEDRRREAQKAQQAASELTWEPLIDEEQKAAKRAAIDAAAMDADQEYQATLNEWDQFNTQYNGTDYQPGEEPPRMGQPQGAPQESMGGVYAVPPRRVPPPPQAPMGVQGQAGLSGGAGAMPPAMESDVPEGMPGDAGKWPPPQPAQAVDEMSRTLSTEVRQNFVRIYKALRSVNPQAAIALRDTVYKIARGELGKAKAGPYQSQGGDFDRPTLPGAYKNISESHELIQDILRRAEAAMVGQYQE